ncbi:MAG: hypothetical protein ACE361_23605 [Aureliella sp.]
MIQVYIRSSSFFAIFVALASGGHKEAEASELSLRKISPNGRFLTTVVDPRWNSINTNYQITDANDRRYPGTLELYGASGAFGYSDAVSANAIGHALAVNAVASAPGLTSNSDSEAIVGITWFDSKWRIVSEVTQPIEPPSDPATHGQLLHSIRLAGLQPPSTCWVSFWIWHSSDTVVNINQIDGYEINSPSRVEVMMGTDLSKLNDSFSGTEFFCPGDSLSKSGIQLITRSAGTRPVLLPSSGSAIAFGQENHRTLATQPLSITPDRCYLLEACWKHNEFALLGIEYRSDSGTLVRCDSIRIKNPTSEGSIRKLLEVQIPDGACSATLFVFVPPISVPFELSAIRLRELERREDEHMRGESDLKPSRSTRRPHRLLPR